MRELDMPDQVMNGWRVDGNENGWGVGTVAFIKDGSGATMPVDFEDREDDPEWEMLDWEHRLYRVTAGDWDLVLCSKDGEGVSQVYMELSQAGTPEQGELFRGVGPLVELWVPGVPAPQGSKKIIRRGKYASMVEDNCNTRPWRALVADCADALVASRTDLDLPFDGPICAEFVFRFMRPASIKPHKRPHPHTKPDLSKLVRAAEDSLSGRLFKDDARIVNYRNTRKEFGPSGVLIRLWKL